MSKNIVVFSDGTGQDGGVGNNTNVYELFNMIEDRTDRQTSFYDPGLGTGWRKVSGTIGAITGMGITRNIRQCYQFISDNYQAGDRLFLLGFSRGATTVRTLSAFIDLFGILPHSRPELINRAYDIYMKHKPAMRREKAEKFLLTNHSMNSDIQFLGVWDTVAALGLPFKTLDGILNWLPGFKHDFHDLSLARRVKYARHAIAIDDKRKTFHPQLWKEQETDDDKKRPNELTEDDIGDVRLIVEQLRTPKATQDPVSKIMMEKFLKKDKEKIESFNSKPDWIKHPTLKISLPSETVRECDRAKLRRAAHGLRTILAEGFRNAIEDKGAFAGLLEPKEHNFEHMGFSCDLREVIGDLQKQGDWPRLNRLLLERTYLLRPMNYPRIKQVWFSGMHSDVGGGYANRELSHVPLLWMLHEATRAGLSIYPDHKVDIRPDALGKMHDSRAGVSRLYRKATRCWDTIKNQNRLPLVHESVKIRHHALGRAYEPWILQMKCNTEPWRQSLRSSIQFNDYYIWRENFWGRNNAFLVSWGNVDRFQYKEDTNELHIYLSKDISDTEASEIVITGALPERVSDLMAHFEQRIVDMRKRKAEKETTESLQKQDVAFKKQDKEHTDKIKRLEERIDMLEKGTDRGPKANGPRSRKPKFRNGSANRS